jgi:hypothetical protein
MAIFSHLSRLARPSEWALEPEPASFAPNGRWSNKDMDPVPLHLRTWTTWAYVAYWISDATNVGTWELASSMLAVGLSWCVGWPPPVLPCLYTSMQAGGASGHRCGQCHSRGCHGPQWDNWCPPAHIVSSPQSLVLWFLVQLLQRRQPHHIVPVLVRCAGHFHSSFSTPNGFG